MKASKHLPRLDGKDIITSACPVGRPRDQGPSPDGFAYPGRSTDKNMLLVFYKQTPGKVPDQGTLNLGVKGEVKIL